MSVRISFHTLATPKTNPFGSRAEPAPFRPHSGPILAPKLRSERGVEIATLQDVLDKCIVIDNSWTKAKCNGIVGTSVSFHSLCLPSTVRTRLSKEPGRVVCTPRVLPRLPLLPSAFSCIAEPGRFPPGPPREIPSNPAKNVHAELAVQFPNSAFA